MKPNLSTKNNTEPRQKILLTALELFATQGFERTTVRQIAKSAAVNISAISYYFEDKVGLYKAAFIEPMGSSKDDIALFNSPDLSLEQALHGLFSGFIEPLKQTACVKQCIRLHMREMVEPTGLWQQEIDDGIRPYQHALIIVLQKYLGLSKVDDDLHRLATSIVAMGVHLYVGREVIEKICPQIMHDNDALDLTQQRLVMYAKSMVDAELKLREYLRNA
jgi:TetR/AcrR family transcriptional regulator, regulator of cefoperazone and chloramphenicol sensitivity